MKNRSACVMLVVLAAVVIDVSHASIISEIDFNRLCNSSALIVEGRVSRIEMQLDADSRQIWTNVTIDVHEVIAGTLEQQRAVISFLGGTYGNLTMKVGDSRTPRVGERGIYFLENPEQRLANPLTGWRQGHFLLETAEDNTERVLASGGQPVLRISTSSSGTQEYDTDGIADGIHVAPAGSGRRTEAIQGVEFKRLIRSTIRTGRSR